MRKLLDGLHLDFTILTKLAAYKKKQNYKYVREKKNDVFLPLHRSVCSPKTEQHIFFLTLPHYFKYFKHV